MRSEATGGASIRMAESLAGRSVAATEPREKSKVTPWRISIVNRKGTLGSEIFYSLRCYNRGFPAHARRIHTGIGVPFAGAHRFGRYGGGAGGRSRRRPRAERRTHPVQQGHGKLPPDE